MIEDREQVRWNDEEQLGKISSLWRERTRGNRDRELPKEGDRDQ